MCTLGVSIFLVQYFLNWFVNEVGKCCYISALDSFDPLGDGCPQTSVIEKIDKG